MAATSSPVEAAVSWCAAETLSEKLGEWRRLAGGRVPQEALSPVQWERWQNQTAHGNETWFAERLSWSGVAVDGHRLMRPPIHDEPVTARDLPWHTVLEELLFGWRADAEPCRRTGLAEVPFGEGFAPVLAFAEQRLRQDAGSSFLAFPNAVAGLLLSLAECLAGISQQVLNQEFQVFPGPFAEAEERPRYDGFTRALRQNGWQELFVRYPALARLIATAIHHWLAASAEFLERLQQDAPHLRELFGADGGVESIEDGLSDPHNGGRTVKIVRFGNGVQVVYKPKSLLMDEGWGRLLAWMEERDLRLDLRAARTLNRQSHGWVEFITARACEDLEQVRRFYFRAGILICLAHALRFTDLHHENVIGSGEHPVPIDLETLLAPDPPSAGGLEPGAPLTRFLQSVNRSFLLPAWTPAENGSEPVDLSGLGGGESTAMTPGRVLRWEHRNTDAMRLVNAPAPMSASANRPLLHGTLVEPADFVDQMVAGFEAAYGFLLQHREQMLSDGGPLAWFQGARSRLVIRHTQLYARLRIRGLMPRMLTQGIERSLEFEALYRCILVSEDTCITPVIAAAEVRALEQMDIPYFEVDTATGNLLVEDRVLERAFVPESGIQAARRVIAGLNPEDERFQIAMIRATFDARTRRAATVAHSAEWSYGERGGAPVRAAEWLEGARKIGDRIEEGAFLHQGRAAWMGLDLLLPSDRYQLQVLGPGLYTGAGGIVLLLAALHAVDGGGSSRRDLALAGVESLRHDFWSSRLHARFSRTLLCAQGIGFASGPGSVIYWLVHSSSLLNAPELLEDAVRVAATLEAGAIRADTQLDVLGGAAGALLALLLLYRATGDARTLSLAVECGWHLVNAQIRRDGQPSGWPTVEGRELTGFSHGAAGISYALLRLYQATGNEQFFAAARAGIAYERSVFLPEAGNWPDLRANKPPGAMARAWCHGGPGIALARLATLDILDDAETRAEIEAGMQSILNFPCESSGLCCGEAGRAAVLLEGARRLRRPEWERDALVRAARVHVPLDRSPLGLAVPGFFQGASGIAYEHLRIQFPGRLPCALLAE
jgi:type 2 lantibiotic biosynthesis protein LanM